MSLTFQKDEFQKLCDRLCRRDPQLKSIIKKFGYPPVWTRSPTFQTWVLILLEQQVSLASAYAAFKKLKNAIGYITPAKILSLSDEQLKACYFSRQKIIYVRELAEAIRARKIILKNLPDKDEETIRVELKKIKGIGDWSVDVYLMHALQRIDIFPLGDLALVNSLKETKNLPGNVSRDEMRTVASRWKPYRTIAAMILWHAYIKKRNSKLYA